MRFLQRSLVGIFLIALTLGLMAWAGKTVMGAVQTRMDQEPRSFNPPERVLAVNAITITPQSIAPKLSTFGEVLSRRTLVVRTSVGGTVIEVAPEFADGGHVEQGALLLRIDPVEAEAALARVEADMLDAEAEARDADRAISLAQDELDAAVAQADLRDSALARQVDLQSRGVGTAAAVETAQLSASSAAQSILSRRQSLAQAEARVDQAQTRLARQSISRAEAQRALDATQIHAAFAGTLGEVSVITGGRVTQNEAIAQIIDPNQLEVSFRISTPQYARLLDTAGQLIRAPVSVSLDVLGVDLLASGRITRESAGVGEGQTGRLLYATLDTARGFRPGDFVTVSVDEPELNGVVLLPATALGSGNTVLLIAEDGRLSQTVVQLVRRQENDVIIRAPDITGQQIVAERSPLLGVGIKVRAIDPNAPVAAAPERPRRGPPPDDAENNGGGEMVVLSEERRAKLLAFLEANSRIPAEIKEDMITQINAEETPVSIVERLENRMGG